MPNLGNEKEILYERIANAIREDEIVHLLCQLISQQSDTYGDQEYGVGQELARYAEANSLKLVLQPVSGKRSNVLIRSQGTTRGKTLMYCGHIDVVPAGNVDLWETPPFQPSVRSGRVFGRGASDMKGSIASALSAVNVLRRAGIELKGDILFALVVDEETRNRGIEAFLASSYACQVDACIVGEPSDLAILLGHKGVLGLWVTFSGRRAHASTPYKGINPLLHCADFVKRVERLQTDVLEKRLHPVLGCPSLTVTMINGGKELNSIPEEVNLRLDRRYLKNESVESCVGEVEAIIDAMACEDETVKGQIRITTVCPPAEICESDPFVHTLSKAICPESPQGAKRGAFLASSEMGIVMDHLNVPTLIFGPGSLDEAHTTNESIDIKQLIRGTELFARIFLEYLGCQTNGVVYG